MRIVVSTSSPPIGETIRIRRRLRFVLVVAITAGPILSAVPAHADSSAPVLDSVERLSPDEPSPKSWVRVAVAGHDDGGSGIHRIFVDFTGPHGHGFGSSIPDNGVVSIYLDEWVASGHYELFQIAICDEAWNCVHQRRDGTYYYYPRGIPDPKPAAIDFSLFDFDVENPNEDITAPTLTEASLVWDEVVAGTPIVMTYDAHDDRSGIAWMVATYIDPAGRHVDLRSDFLPAFGPAHVVLPLSAPGGRYRLQRLFVRDNAENETYYHASGSINPAPRVSLPEHQPPDMTTLDFTVTPVKEDRSFPVVDQISRTSPAVVRAGEDVVVDFSVSDEWTGVEHVLIEWTDRYGHSLSANRTCDLLGDSRAAMRLADWWPPGEWTAQSVMARDRQGNMIWFRRDRTITTYPYDRNGPFSHTLDLAALDYTIEAGEPRSEGLVSLDPCVPDPDVHAAAASAHADPGADLALVGNVSRQRRAVPGPVVVFYAYQNKRPIGLLGVDRGADDGTFARTVTARKDTEYRVNFLGADGSVPARSRASDFFAAEVGRRTSLTLDAPLASTSGTPISLVVRLGEATTDTGIGGREVLLLARPPGGASTIVDRRSTASDGSIRFTTSPTSTTEYSARFSGTDEDLAAQTGIKRVTIGNATPSLALTGSSITTSGIPASLDAMLRTGDAPVAGRTIMLEVRDGSAAFRRVTIAVTGSDGVAHFRVAPIRNAEYRATSAGTAGPAQVSDVFRVWVRPRLVVRTSASRVRMGAPVTLSVASSPAHPGSSIVLLRKVGTIWRREAWIKLSRDGTAAITIRPARGTTQYMLAVPSHADHVAGYSSVITITAS